jgi:hypothetical protein
MQHRKQWPCRTPIPANSTDALLLACIRRINLNTFWSQARCTVESNRDKAAFVINLFKTVGLLGTYKAQGHLPEFDHCGYEVATQMVLHSRRSGHYSKKYFQFNTIRKLWSSFSNHCRASAQSNRVTLMLRGQKGKYQKFSADPYSSFWFYHFIEGVRLRMGPVGQTKPSRLSSWYSFLNWLIWKWEKPPLCERRIVGLCSTRTWSFVMYCHFAGAKASYVT